MIKTLLKMITKYYHKGFIQDICPTFIPPSAFALNAIHTINPFKSLFFMYNYTIAHHVNAYYLES